MGLWNSCPCKLILREAMTGLLISQSPDVSLGNKRLEMRKAEGGGLMHKACTNGFSVGYYYTVGSKEGWNPQSSTYPRKNRAEIKQQSDYNFLDDDEKDKLDGCSLATLT